MLGLLVADGQEALAEKWAASLGRDYQVGLQGLVGVIGMVRREGRCDATGWMGTNGSGDEAGCIAGRGVRGGVRERVVGAGGRMVENGQEALAEESGVLLGQVECGCSHPGLFHTAPAPQSATLLDGALPCRWRLLRRALPWTD